MLTFVEKKQPSWKVLKEKGQPKIKPLFPAGVGLYGMPTTINNVESIAVVPTILRRGPDWFSSIGKENNTGTKIFLYFWKCQ